MERCGDALRYMRFILRAKRDEDEAIGIHPAKKAAFAHNMDKINAR
jgi:hypothetical protein